MLRWWLGFDFAIVSDTMQSDLIQRTMDLSKLESGLWGASEADHWAAFFEGVTSYQLEH